LLLIHRNVTDHAQLWATVAMAADSCDRAVVVALVFWLWGCLRKGCHGHSGLCVEIDSKFCSVILVFYLFSITFGLFRFIQLRIFGLNIVFFCVQPLQKF
jgi:hypothetical protein